MKDENDPEPVGSCFHSPLEYKKKRNRIATMDVHFLFFKYDEANSGLRLVVHLVSTN